VSLKSVLKPWLRPLPQWAAVGIVPPQQAISVSLDWNGRSVDATANHTIASLRPLAVAIGFSDVCAIPSRATLVYRDNVTSSAIGHVALRHSTARVVAGMPIGIFDVDGADQRCLNWPQRPWNVWLQSRAIRRNKNPHNFQMTPSAVLQLMTFYICPRPVVLVTVSAPAHSNIFPMDLIGALANSCFTLALRSTSVSVPAMIESGRFAISGIGAEHKDAVYKLGEHHKRAFADWEALPFSIAPTETFGIPAVASALWIRELAVQHSEQIGSHTFFVCRVVSERELSRGPQLHHTAGFHQEFRRRKGRAFAWA
jgi:flavin reductase (DIM6/NTAB) family NADH-FMN oxidoreductase RutF